MISVLIISSPIYCQELNEVIDKSNSSIGYHLVWEKSFFYLKKSDYTNFQKLLTQFTNVNSFECGNSQVLKDKLFEAIVIKDKDLIKTHLLELIVSGITYDLYLMREIDNTAQIKQNIKNLYREIIAIQFELKSYDFDLYVDLIKLIKNANNSSYSVMEYSFYISNLLEQNKITVKCKEQSRY